MWSRFAQAFVSALGARETAGGFSGRRGGDAQDMTSTVFLPLALAGGSLIFVLFLVAFFFAVAHGFYSRRGSGINQRPTDGRGEAPGADGASSITTTEGDGDERTVGTRGTK